MTQVPLPQGVTGVEDTPKLQEHLINLFFADGYLLRTPGRELVTTVGTLGCRGSSTWYVDENAYFVIGNTLYQLDSTESVTSIGTIAGTTDVVFSLGQVNLVIIVKGGNGYTYNSSTGLVQITDTDFVASDSVDFIDGRHVFIPTDGSPAFYSEVDAPGNINPLNFFDAEELPDLNRANINVGNQMYILGSESAEIYRTTTSTVAPFQRREGARIDVGYVAGLERYLSSFVFIGRNREQSYAIHLMSQGSTQVISNEAINELLNTEYTKSELLLANSTSFVWKGHNFVAWNLPRHTIAFVDGNWVYFDSKLDGTDIGPWDGKAVTFAHGRYYAGDRITGNIGKLIDTPTEYGESVEYEIKSFVRTGRKRYFSPSSMVIDSLTGENGTTIGLSVSKDGRSYGDFHYRTLGATGAYGTIVQWAGGLGIYESFMGFKLRGTGDVRLSVESVDVT